MKKNPGMVFPARGKLSKILFVVRLKFECSSTFSK